MENGPADRRCGSPLGDLFRISILYSPRLPADPFARSELTRSFVFSLRAYKRHANAHTLGPRAWDPGPKKRAQVPGAQGGPSGPLGKGAFGALGGARGPMGPFGVIPRLFRMDLILREASVGVHFQRFPSE